MKSKIGQTEALAIGVAIGAGLMYLMEHNRLKRPKEVKARVRGAVSETRALFKRDGAHDGVIAERVRGALERTTPNARNIVVNVNSGRVMLSGMIVDADEEAVLSAVASVTGVRGVQSRLEVSELLASTVDEPVLVIDL